MDIVPWSLLLSQKRPKVQLAYFIDVIDHSTMASWLPRSSLITSLRTSRCTPLKTQRTCLRRKTTGSNFKSSSIDARSQSSSRTSNRSSSMKMMWLSSSWGRSTLSLLRDNSSRPSRCTRCNSHMGRHNSKIRGSKGCLRVLLISLLSN